MAHPGSLVSWAVNVTLKCQFEFRADTFLLHEEDSLDHSWQLHLQDTAAPSQANFTISPVTWSRNGTYRCYSSHSSSPFLLSQHSDPLELLRDSHLMSIEGADSVPGILWAGMGGIGKQ